MKRIQLVDLIRC